MFTVDNHGVRLGVGQRRQWTVVAHVTPPATEEEVSRLNHRLWFEVGITNALGTITLALAFFFLEPPAREAIQGVPWALAFTVVIPLYAVGAYGTYRLVRPLNRWLRTGIQGQPAPPEVQRLVLAHPALQALMLLGLWVLTAGALAVAHVTRTPEDPLRAFVSTFTGVSIAGLVVATLAFLADQRVLGPWYERFFASDDPTRHRIPSTRVGRRMFVAFALGAAVPMVLIGFAVSERFANPRDIAQIETVTWFLVAVGIGTGLLLTLAVRESVARPLGLIRSAADSVRHGDLSVRVPVESADEFGELALAFNAMVEGLRERRRLEDLFGRQVGGAVAQRALHQGVALGGERRTASVLIIDLAGFTELTEEMAPERVVATLNRVFSVVIREVEARQGLINKFMGDAVLAVFGAPLDDPDHARHALEAARAIASALADEGVRFGVGVSTGDVVAGNVGALERFEYTVVGDAVNEASRLQDLTRERSEPVLVSGRTVSALGEQNGLVRVGTASLRGRSAPTDLYALGEGVTR